MPRGQLRTAPFPQIAPNSDWGRIGLRFPLPERQSTQRASRNATMGMGAESSLLGSDELAVFIDFDQVQTAVFVVVVYLTIENTVDVFAFSSDHFAVQDAAGELFAADGVHVFFQRPFS